MPLLAPPPWPTHYRAPPQVSWVTTPPCPSLCLPPVPQSRSQMHLRLPLDAEECEWYLTFDVFSAWVMAAAFAPFFLAFLWHIILLATLYLPWLRLAEGPQQEAGGGMGLGTADVAMAF